MDAVGKRKRLLIITAAALITASVAVLSAIPYRLTCGRPAVPHKVVHDLFSIAISANPGLPGWRHAGDRSSAVEPLGLLGGHPAALCPLDEARALEPRLVDDAEGPRDLDHVVLLDGTRAAGCLRRSLVVPGRAIAP